MSSNKKIAFNYFGGKFTWLGNLYENFPLDFTHLVDLFAGSMVVSLNYPGNVIRTANEVNGEITNFFEVLRDHEVELVRTLRLTPCSEREYRKCWGGNPTCRIWSGRDNSTSGCGSRFSVLARSARTKAGTWRSSRSM